MGIVLPIQRSVTNGNCASHSAILLQDYQRLLWTSAFYQRFTMMASAVHAVQQG